MRPELWRWTVEWIDTPALLTQYLDLAQRARDEGSQVPCVTVEQSSGRLIGSTRYLNIDRAHHRLEIGYTWVAPPWQRSGANLEAKLLQLRHAFETLGCRRVEFKTNSLNEKSNAALAGDRRLFRGHLPQPHDQPGRPHAALVLLQRHRHRVACGPRAPGGACHGAPFDEGVTAPRKLRAHLEAGLSSGDSVKRPPQRHRLAGVGGRTNDGHPIRAQMSHILRNWGDLDPAAAARGSPL